MLYAIQAKDKPDASALRLATRTEHLDYTMSEDSPVQIAGPILSDDGATMIGSILIIEADSLDAAKQWAELDPYARAGLFAQVEVHPWKWVIGNPEVEA